MRNSAGAGKRRALFFGIALAVLIADQASKLVARHAFTYTLNSGTVFGALPDYNLLFGTVTFLTAAAILFFLPRMQQEHTAAALIFGGATGNLLDRILLGGVVDFIRVGSFPAFNAADSALTIGAILLLVQWRTK